MAQFMVAAVIMIGLGLAIAEFSKRSNQAVQKSRVATSTVEMGDDIAAINKDISRWLAAVRDPVTIALTSDSVVANCLPDTSTGTVPSCPPANDLALITDANLTKRVPAGGAINPVNLIDATPNGAAKGTLIAGSCAPPCAAGAVGPVYYDQTGKVCAGAPTSPTCMYRATGYLIRQNAAGNPGLVTAVVKIESNAAVKTSAVIAAKYLDVNVGRAWDSLSQKTVCPAGQLSGLDGNGNAVCFTALCPVPGQMIVGWNTAVVPIQPICENTQTIVQKTPGNCPANEALIGFQANGTPICQKPKNVWTCSAWSACGCGADPWAGIEKRTCSVPYPGFPPSAPEPPLTKACTCCHAPVWNPNRPGGYYDSTGNSAACLGPAAYGTGWSVSQIKSMATKLQSFGLSPGTFVDLPAGPVNPSASYLVTGGAFSAGCGYMAPAGTKCNTDPSYCGGTAPFSNLVCPGWRCTGLSYQYTHTPGADGCAGDGMMNGWFNEPDGWAWGLTAVPQ